MRVIRSLFGPVFILAGLNHFVSPGFYLRIMPPWLPAHEAMNAVSGAAEIAGGAAIMARDPGVRRFGGILSIATLVAVFPANVHMALNPDDFPEVPGGAATLWARLPLQAVFIAWALAAMRPPRPRG
jgi:uncharacterized membrane protein